MNLLLAVQIAQLVEHFFEGLMGFSYIWNKILEIFIKFQGYIIIFCYLFYHLNIFT